VSIGFPDASVPVALKAPVDLAATRAVFQRLKSKKMNSTAPITPKGLAKFGAEPELVHDLIFCLGQFSGHVPLNREHIPSRTMRHGAFGRFYQGRVFMHTATVTPTVCPTSFIVGIEKLIAQPQRR